MYRAKRVGRNKNLKNRQDRNCIPQGVLFFEKMGGQHIEKICKKGTAFRARRPGGKRKTRRGGAWGNGMERRFCNIVAKTPQKKNGLLQGKSRPKILFRAASNAARARRRGGFRRRSEPKAALFGEAVSLAAGKN